MFQNISLSQIQKFTYNTNNTNTNECLRCCHHGEAIARVHPVYLMNANWAPALKPSQPTWPVSPPVGCYHSHSPSPFSSITQPESWYSFYRPTKDGRLSRARHCSKGVQHVLKAVHRSGCRVKHNCPRPFTPQSSMLPLNHCDLQKQVGVNNLPVINSAAAGNRIRSRGVASPTS